MISTCEGVALPVGRWEQIPSTVCESLLEALLRTPYFSQPPPKSCGFEEFGEAFVRSAREQAPEASVEDLVATMTELTGRTVGEAIARFLQGDTPWELIISGGGAHNSQLLARIERWSGLTPRLSSELGIDIDAKEAIAFAFLACETLAGRPGNLPSATGARGCRVLGKVTPRG